jgi:hypothetical protein
MTSTKEIPLKDLYVQLEDIEKEKKRVKEKYNILDRQSKVILSKIKGDIYKSKSNKWVILKKWEMSRLVSFLEKNFGDGIFTNSDIRIAIMKNKDSIFPYLVNTTEIDSDWVSAKIITPLKKSGHITVSTREKYFITRQ